VLAGAVGAGSHEDPGSVDHEVVDVGRAPVGRLSDHKPFSLSGLTIIGARLGRNR